MASSNPPTNLTQPVADVVPKIEPTDGTVDAELDVEMTGGQTGDFQASSSTMEGDAATTSFNQGGNGSAGQAGNEEEGNNGVPQTAMDANAEQGRMPVRKDVSMREFLGKMDDYAPVIPDAVLAHHLTKAGIKPPPLSAYTRSTDPSTNPQNTSSSNGYSVDDDAIDLRLMRLLGLATVKFASDIAKDAFQHSKMRSGTLTSNTLSSMSNPGAPGPAGAGAGAGGAGVPAGGSGVGGGAGGVGGTAGAGKGGAAGGHVLGMQRAGYGGGGQGGGQGRTVLTMEDLGQAVGEYGINVKRPEFYR